MPESAGMMRVVPVIEPAENMFLRKQLALYQERRKKAVPTKAADRFVLSKLARFFDWRSPLVIVKPATLIGWHVAAFRRFWRWKSRPAGRPPISAQVRALNSQNGSRESDMGRRAASR